MGLLNKALKLLIRQRTEEVSDIIQQALVEADAFSYTVRWDHLPEPRWREISLTGRVGDRQSGIIEEG